MLANCYDNHIRVELYRTHSKPVSSQPAPKPADKPEQVIELKAEPADGVFVKKPKKNVAENIASKLPACEQVPTGCKQIPTSCKQLSSNPKIQAIIDKRRQLCRSSSEVRIAPQAQYQMPKFRFPKLSMVNGSHSKL